MTLELGVRVADVAKALALVIYIGPVGVCIPGPAATKMVIGKTPCTEGAPII